MTTTRTQRWRDRRTKFVPAATVIDPRDYSVDIIHSEKTAAPFLAAHHYLRTLPAARLSVGLFRNGPAGHPELVGVAVFSQPVNNASVRLRTGLNDSSRACDLGRLVLRDNVAGNGESWFVARAFRLLRAEKPAIEAVIAYSDPIRQQRPDGTIILPGHVGLIYSALSATYTGRTQPRRRTLLPDGTILSDRTIAKLRANEIGADGAAARLIAVGCSPQTPHEEYGAWYARLQNENILKQSWHPGCHAYSFALTRAARHALRDIPQDKPPTRDPAIVCGDITALPLLAA